MSTYNRRLPLEVEAVRLVTTIYDNQGNALAVAGDWLLVSGQEQFYMSDEEFKKTFDKKPPEKEVVVKEKIVEKNICLPPPRRSPYRKPCPPPDPWRFQSVIQDQR